MSEKMAVYTYDKDMIFTGSLLVDDDYELIDGETEVKPEDGLYEPIKFDGNKWVGSSKEDFDAAQEAARKAELAKNPKQPTATDKLLADLMLKQAQQDKINETLLQSAKSE